MHIVTVDGILRSDTLGHRTPVTYRFELRAADLASPASVWDEINIQSVTRLVGPSTGELIKYPIRWTHIGDRKGFEQMLAEAVGILHKRGLLKPPIACKQPAPTGSDPARGVARLVQELLP